MYKVEKKQKKVMLKKIIVNYNSWCNIVPIREFVVRQLQLLYTFLQT